MSETDDLVGVVRANWRRLTLLALGVFAGAAPVLALIGYVTQLAVYSIDPRFHGAPSLGGLLDADLWLGVGVCSVLSGVAAAAVALKARTLIPAARDLSVRRVLDVVTRITLTAMSVVAVAVTIMTTASMTRLID